MTFVLVYAATLLAVVLLSDLVRRSVLSTAVLFLAVGFVTGPGFLGWIGPGVSGEAMKRFAELALVTVLERHAPGGEVRRCQVRSQGLRLGGLRLVDRPDLGAAAA